MTIATIRLAAVALFCCSTAFAQQLQLPAKSPGAKLTQTVGLTDITIEYSSPAVHGRKVWGALVPYNEVWRTGANAATKLTFSKDVEVDGKPVPAGSYAFFAIPTAKDWTLILNKVADQGGSFGYKQDSDLLRVTVKPAASPMRERLSYQVTNFTDDTASIDLEWEKVKVSLPVKLKTKELSLANIQAAQDNLWSPMTNAARYLLDQKMYPEAMAKVDVSIAQKETWLNTWVKAQVLAAQGKYKDAYPFAQKAKDLGDKEGKEKFFFADDVNKALAEWKNKG